MKKIIAMFVALVAMMGMASAGTTVDTSWSGSGNFETHFTAGDDAQSHFWTGGNGIVGEFHGEDKDDNPYGYGVDTVTTNVRNSMDGGWQRFKMTRDDSKVSMYGQPGEETYTFLESTGSNKFEWKVTTNYAQMRNINWGWASQPSISANGDYVVDHYFAEPDIAPNPLIGMQITDKVGAEYHASGTGGNIDIVHYTDDEFGTGFEFGKGCCSYGASVTGTNGNFYVAGQGNNINAPWGSGQYTYAAVGGNSFSMPDFAMDGN